MKFEARIRTTESTTIEVEAATLDKAREQFDAQLPEGFQILAIRQIDE
jgi:hypothetical protein